MVKDLNSSDFLLVLTTEKNYKHAKSLARKLLKKNLAACISLRKTKSLFWWKGKIEESSEVQLTIKTSEVHRLKLLKEIKNLHTYNVPEILFFPVKSDQRYESWLV